MTRPRKAETTVDNAPTVPAPGSTMPAELLLLRLFVAGNSPRSNQVIQTLRQLCDERLLGKYRLEVVDIYQQPAMARQQQIVATPTLIKMTPLPKKILIGNLSHRERVLACLGLTY
jgi:circadian clock protein KaiB